MKITFDLPIKEAEFVRKAVYNQIKQYQNQMQDETLSDDEQADLGNDYMLYECILEYIDYCFEEFKKQHDLENL